MDKSVWQWGIFDAEINVPSVDDLELTNYLPLKRGAGKIINHAEEEEEEKRKEKGHSAHRITD